MPKNKHQSRRSFLPLPQITLSGYCMTSLPIDQIRFNATYIKRKERVPINQTQKIVQVQNVSLVIIISITIMLINSTQADIIILLYYWQHQCSKKSSIKFPLHFQVTKYTSMAREPALLCCINTLHSYLHVRCLFCTAHIKISHFSSNSKIVPFIFSWRC